MVRTQRGLHNGGHACTRRNLVTLRGAEWLHWLANPHSHVRVCVASMSSFPLHWVVRTERGLHNGYHACTRGNQVTLRGAH